MEDTCVVCGKIVPEGRQVCPTCERENGCLPDDRKAMAYLLHQSAWKESEAAVQNKIRGHFSGGTGKRPDTAARPTRPRKAFRQLFDYLDAFFISRKKKRRGKP